MQTKKRQAESPPAKLGGKRRRCMAIGSWTPYIDNRRLDVSVAERHVATFGWHVPKSMGSDSIDARVMRLIAHQSSLTPLIFIYAAALYQLHPAFTIATFGKQLTGIHHTSCL
jgi:hypothetical protein